MNIIIKIIPVFLYVFVGIISLIMAHKSLFSKKFLPFHEKAAGKSWDKIEPGLQFVVLALMKVSGLGFLVVGLSLIIFPIINYFQNNSFIQYAIPAISLLYCFGLFLVNYQLKIKTNANTPWKPSLYTAIIIGIGIIISCI